MEPVPALSADLPAGCKVSKTRGEERKRERILLLRFLCLLLRLCFSFLPPFFVLSPFPLPSLSLFRSPSPTPWSSAGCSPSALPTSPSSEAASKGSRRPGRGRGPPGASPRTGGGVGLRRLREAGTAAGTGAAAGRGQGCTRRRGRRPGLERRLRPVRPGLCPDLPQAKGGRETRITTERP